MDMSYRDDSDNHLHDYLTELPNRDYIYEYIVYLLQMSELYESRFALLTVRINGLKHINNSLGIFIGDAMLKKVGTLIKSAATEGMGQEVFTGRLSGGDFAVLIPFKHQMKGEPGDISSDERRVRLCCEAIINITKDQIEINEYKLYPSVNIGASIYPYHGATAEELLRKADLAKGTAKQDRHNTYSIYDIRMDGDVERIMFLNNSLPVAIATNQFELFFQAQMEVRTETIVGAEALIRWRHPEKGLIFPDYFITYAENNGYALQIDLLVLEMACEQVNTWQRRGLNIPVSVNISARHFANGLICDSVSKVLANKQTDPSMLKIELVESALIEDFYGAVKVINDLKEMGVTVALDDFGTGYSSLEYVARLPLDYLKVDRTFSMHMDKNPSYKIILETIMTLAKGMKVKTIVEGVESQLQLDFLKTIGSNLAQGYFINKPMPVGQFEELLAKYN
jgi:diguanylate cyclase (GGDEF)-like protein